VQIQKYADGIKAQAWVPGSYFQVLNSQG